MKSMKSLTEILSRTPWWALLIGALAIFVALAVFVTPYHIIQYRDDGRSEEETRAIKREVDNTFVENALNLGRGVVKNMLARTTDPDRREELQLALEGLEEARQELREAGSEALRARRETLEAARVATQNAHEAMRNLEEQVGKSADREALAELKAIERALKSAQRKEREAERQLKAAQKKARRIVIGPDADGKPAIEIEIDATPDDAEPAVPASPPPAVLVPPSPPGAGAPAPPAPPADATPPLPPDLARKIRRDVTGDMYRIGIGAALMLVLLPLFIVAVVIKFFADRSRASQRVAETKRKEAEYHRMGQQVTEAKLAALQAQVEPHFLYNTLASVQALTEVDPAKAHDMTGHLIQYLRNALPKMRESVSTVGQEVELVRAYLSILQMRMGARLAFEIAVPGELMALPFPPLMLPSLVENAIKHGLEPQREGGAVRITAELVDGRLRMVVSDTGRGFAETPGAGVGLTNIRERLAALYGDAARLTLEANQPRGVVAMIEVPAEGTRSAAAGGFAPGFVPPPPAPPPPSAPGPAPAVATLPAPETVWSRTWAGLVVAERIWRTALYYLFIGLVVVAGVIAIGGVIGVAAGLVPVTTDSDVINGPAGALVVLGIGVVAFVVAAAALAIAILVVYGVGFFVFALVIFVLFVVLIAMSPVLAPFILVGVLIWWMARRKARAKALPGAAAPGEAAAGAER